LSRERLRRGYLDILIMPWDDTLLVHELRFQRGLLRPRGSTLHDETTQRYGSQQSPNAISQSFFLCRSANGSESYNV
jgi:hypothetical protein